MKKSIYIHNTNDPEMQKALSLIFNLLGGEPDIITLTANGDQVLGKALVIGVGGCFYCDPPIERFYISRGGPEHFTPCPLCEPRGRDSYPAKTVSREQQDGQRLMASRPVTRRVM